MEADALFKRNKVVDTTTERSTAFGPTKGRKEGKKREKKTSHKRENSLLFIARQILIQIKLHLLKTIFLRSNNTNAAAVQSTQFMKSISPGWTTRSNCAGERLN